MLCMNTAEIKNLPNYPLADLCVLADMSLRTVRYYVQIGLVDKPEGETRAAKYGPRHLEQLIQIKKWTLAGLSLERIRDLLHGNEAAIPPRPKAAGSIEICSHLSVADGIEIVIEPERAGMTSEQMRKFVRSVMQAYFEISQPDPGSPNK